MNEEMVRLGFAWAYRKYLTPHYDYWTQLESDAKRNKFWIME